jgi:Sulfotransferase family
MEKFFIVGCPRSGTTMVQQALNRHTGIVIPPETKFFFSFLGHSRRVQLRHLKRLNNDLRIDLPEPANRISTAAEGRAFYETMAAQYVERLKKKDVVYFGEKTPEHTGHLPRMQQLFPDAKIVVLYRDGRDVALSLTKMPWMCPDLYVNFVVWLYYYHVVRKFRSSGHPNFYFARYESIVADPEKELGGLLQFLGLPYQAAVAEEWGNREGVPEREYAWKEQALHKITGDRVGVFRRELSTHQIEMLERLGRQALVSLGYDLMSDGKRALSPQFLLNLSYRFARFAYRLPWHAVASELFVRLFPRRRIADASLSTNSSLASKVSAANRIAAL